MAHDKSLWQSLCQNHANANAIGIAFDGERENKPESITRQMCGSERDGKEFDTLAVSVRRILRAESVMQNKYGMHRAQGKHYAFIICID